MTTTSAPDPGADHPAQPINGQVHPPGARHGAPPPGPPPPPPVVPPLLAAALAAQPGGLSGVQVSAAAVEATHYLKCKVMILERRAQLDRIAAEVLAMLPALPAGHTAYRVVTETADLLRAARPSRTSPEALPEPDPAADRPALARTARPLPAWTALPAPPPQALRPPWLTAWDQAFRDP